MQAETSKMFTYRKSIYNLFFFNFAKKSNKKLCKFNSSFWILCYKLKRWIDQTQRMSIDLSIKSKPTKRTKNWTRSIKKLNGEKIYFFFNSMIKFMFNLTVWHLLEHISTFVSLLKINNDIVSIFGCFRNFFMTVFFFTNPKKGRFVANRKFKRLRCQH